VVEIVLERVLERHFSQECKRLNLTTLKLALRFSTGWPDRLVLLKRGKILWAELKTSVGVLSERQKAIHNILREHNHTVLVLRTKQEITDALETASISAKRSKVSAKQRLFPTMAGPRSGKNQYNVKGNKRAKKSGASKQGPNISPIAAGIRSLARGDPEVG